MRGGWRYSLRPEGGGKAFLPPLTEGPKEEEGEGEVTVVY